MTTLKKLAILLFVSIPMVGCVAGQSVTIDYSAEAMAVAPADAGAVRVTVADKRPFVLSGDKPAYFVGKYRAGFGNPWDVTTEDRKPLAELMQADVVEELQALGFGTDGAGKTLAVTINDWNFDGWQNGRLWYDIAIMLSSSDGTELYSGAVKEEVGITGTLSGIKGGVERDIPVIYSNAIKKIVRENSELLSALSR